jgi:hypothetical protein
MKVIELGAGDPILLKKIRENIIFATFFGHSPFRYKRESYGRICYG